MKNIKSIFISIALLITVNSVMAQDNEWALKKNKDGIEVYTRVDEESGLIEFKSTITLATNLETLLNVFNDVEGYTKWMADTKVSTVLEKINANESYIYFEAQVPWPLENRDMPLYQKIEKTTNGIYIYLTGVEDYIPHKKRITRIENAVGYWELTQIKNNQIRVKYGFLADPGLNIPNWIINLFIVDGPYKTLINLKEVVKN